VDKESPRQRKINKLPLKVLDAPSLQDDYYLNLLDWGPQNLLAVGLSSSVYLWNASNSKVNRICDLGNPNVSSVGWAQRGSLLAVGSENGEVQVWDT
jgi:cell division cycle 20-like protein 1 (cofactor of APC complex)